MFEISHVHVCNANCITCCLSSLGNVLCLCKIWIYLTFTQAMFNSEWIFWVAKFLFEMLKIGHGKPTPTLVSSICWVRPFSGHMKPNKCAKREMFALCYYDIDIVFSLCYFSPLHMMFSNFSRSKIRVIFVGWKTNHICTWN